MDQSQCVIPETVQFPDSHLIQRALHHLPARRFRIRFPCSIHPHFHSHRYPQRFGLQYCCIYKMVLSLDGEGALSLNTRRNIPCSRSFRSSFCVWWWHRGIRGVLRWHGGIRSIVRWNYERRIDIGRRSTLRWCQ